MAKKRMNKGCQGILHRRVRGFSLLEVLVAFVILALAMTVLMQIFSRGLIGADLAERYSKAALLAESKLAAIGVEEPLKEGTYSGKFDDDFSWQLVVKPFHDATLKKNPDTPSAFLPVQLFEVELAVRFTTDDKRERTVTLTTLQLAPTA